MNAVRLVCLVACLALPLTGCATREVPYEPGPVRITDVDYREAPAPALESGGWKLLVSKETLFTDDALTVTVLLDGAALGRESVLRVSVARAADRAEPAAPAFPPVRVPADAIALADLRNTQIDIHVYFIGAPPGRYDVVAEVTPPGGAPARRLERAVTLSARP